jgi:anti-sigma factor RsiW
MSIHRIQHDLSAYLDGELPPEEMADVRRHVAQCQACQDELEELRSTKKLLSRLAQPELPPDFARELWSRIEQKPRQRRWMWLPRPAVALAAIALALVLAAVPLVRGHLERLKAAEVSPDLFIRTYMPIVAEDPLMDRAFLTLITTDANLRLVGDEARGEARGDSRR